MVGVGFVLGSAQTRIYLSFNDRYWCEVWSGSTFVLWFHDV